MKTQNVIGRIEPGMDCQEDSWGFGLWDSIGLKLLLLSFKESDIIGDGKRKTNDLSKGLWILGLRVEQLAPAALMTKSDISKDWIPVKLQRFQ